MEVVPGNPGAKSMDPPSGYKWKVLSTVIFGIFMVILDSTVVNVAFQTLRQEFGSNINDAQWIISVYVLALGISMPLAGFLADRFGIKKIYLGGLLIFVLGVRMKVLNNPSIVSSTPVSFSLYSIMALKILCLQCSDHV